MAVALFGSPPPLASVAVIALVLAFVLLRLVSGSATTAASGAVLGQAGSTAGAKLLPASGDDGHDGDDGDGCR